jgi:peptide/nickel transport system ATP-binding protein
MMNPEEPLLCVRGLTTRLTQKGLAYKVVNNLSFELKKGQTLALVGESGCGKSMSALSILRLLPTPPALPSEGEVLCKGKNLLTLPESEMQKIRGAKISMIFQDPLSAFNPVYTIGHQLLEVAMTHLNISPQGAKELVCATLEEVSLPNPLERMHEYPHQMSGGMLQRAMIAMAILCKPDILIADEPTTALDVTIQAQILALMDDLKKKRGMSILLITHDMGVVAEIADRVAVMYASEKVEEGDVEQIFDAPSHPYTQALFHARMNATNKKGKLATIKGSVPSLANLPSGCHFAPRCAYRMSICNESKVPFFDLKQKGHEARCWLFDQNLKEKVWSDEQDS